ncbi:MAG: chemotaxis protein CheX [Tuberibacillus sp.]
MNSATKDSSRIVTDVLNSSLQSIKTVIPMEHTITPPKLLEKTLSLEFGVLIGITGDLKGKLILSGPLHIFAGIGEVMFGMALEGDMLKSFSGELGNMLGGSLSTHLYNSGITIDITSPTIIEGHSKISGFSKAIGFAIVFENQLSLNLCLAIDQ